MKDYGIKQKFVKAAEYLGIRARSPCASVKITCTITSLLVNFTLIKRIYTHYTRAHVILVRERREIPSSLSTCQCRCHEQPVDTAAVKETTKHKTDASAGGPPEIDTKHFTRSSI